MFYAKSLLFSLLLSLFLLSPCLADWSPGRPDGHAPIGVMGEHTHNAGESMLSYRYMYMSMDGLRNGTSSVSAEKALESYMVAPLEMDMEMHMIGGMFAPRDWLTLMTMVPILDISMGHRTRMGKEFTTTSSGLGDISFSGLVRVLHEDDQRIHLNFGVSLPSGEIDERDDTPAMKDAKLPYPMQLGSGTVDLKPGVTYLGQQGELSWGVQGIGTIRLGRNDNDYSLGDRFDSTAWGALQFCDFLSGSLRTDWSIWGNIDGQDSDLNPMMVPTADTHLQGGQEWSFGVGVNSYVPPGNILSGTRLAVEFLVPLMQDLDGPQLETDWTLIAGIQASF
ncbi:hypothetical protein BVY02_02190 [bacterium J17]|nr:hypothetical protein BVY02_02190 [bacterium J17]